MEKRRFCLIAYILLMCIGANVYAQTTTEPDTVLSETARYRLLSPLNFSHSTVSRTFDFSQPADSSTVSPDAAVDRLMMHLYLNRPDLVQTTDTQLDEVASVDGTLTKASQQEVKPIDNKKIDVVDDIVPEVTVQMVVEKPKFWTFKGDYYLQFMQNYLSENWYKGGESNYSFLANAVLEANYNNKSKLTWDNKLEAKIGFQTSKGDTVHQFKTSEDLLRYTGKLGIQATKKWYYTLQLLAYTQFMPGYKANDEKVYSDFFSPLNLNLAVGMSYKLDAFKSRLTGSVFISPLAYNYKFVGRADLITKNGIDDRWHHKEDVGSSLTADISWQILDNLKWKSRLYAFTSYERMEAEWENTFTFSFNKYITTNLFVYPRFDDSAKTYDPDYGFFQLKEYWSLGFAYSF